MTMPSFSGLFDTDGSGGENYELLVKRSPLQKQLARAFKRRSLRRFGNYMAQLTTSDSPDADVQYSRVNAVADVDNLAVQGGKRMIETVTVQASTTNYSSEDATDAEEMGNMSNDPDTYPTDAAGNGGGGKGENTAPSLG
jgi:hypothetical protein